ncbi:hypothetical protein, partial [Enterobacter hormaechei]|uniref:hypothetical protein n=1 Tax=Enterobacter hormaechei TaxID=158836 RepID=UPI0019539500
TAYGHWDVDPRSPSHNLIPTKELAALGITKAYTGHVHLPSTFKRDGVEVEVVGGACSPTRRVRTVASVL